MGLGLHLILAHKHLSLPPPIAARAQLFPVVASQLLPSPPTLTAPPCRAVVPLLPRAWRREGEGERKRGEEEEETRRGARGPTLSQLPRRIKPETKPLRDLVRTGFLSRGMRYIGFFLFKDDFVTR